MRDFRSLQEGAFPDMFFFSSCIIIQVTRSADQIYPQGFKRTCFFGCCVLLLAGGLRPLGACGKEFKGLGGCD